MIIAVDFDGALSRAEYPDCGNPNQKVFRKLIDRKNDGARIILNTCRHGSYLNDAVQFCEDNGLTFDAVNENLPDIIAKYGDSRKIYADLYVDDNAINTEDFEAN